MKKIDFSQNLNILGPAPQAILAAREAAEEIVRYPDRFSTKLKAAVAQTMGLPDECLAFGAGVTEICFNLPGVIRQGNSLVPEPTFWQYRMAIERHCSSDQVTLLRLDPAEDFRISSDAFQSTASGCSAAYICNPNNPTSQACAEGQLAQLVRDNPSVDFIVDETYLYFLPDYAEQTVSHLLPDCRNLYVCTSFSKFFAIPGARIGLLTSAPENIERYENYRHPFSVTPVAEAALLASLKDNVHIERSRQTYGQLIQQAAYNLPSQLDPSAYRVIPPEGPYVLVEILSTQTSTQITQLLAKSGLLIRDCSTMQRLNNKWFRFAVRTPCEQQQLIDHLNKIV